MYYAVKHKTSTNIYLMSDKSRGHTHIDPFDPPKRSVPRLFTSKNAASQALNWWSQGIYKLKLDYTGEILQEQFIGQANRVKDEWEVLEVQIYP